MMTSHFTIITVTLSPLCFVTSAMHMATLSPDELDLPEVEVENIARRVDDTYEPDMVDTYEEGLNFDPEDAISKWCEAGAPGYADPGPEKRTLRTYCECKKLSPQLNWLYNKKGNKLHPLRGKKCQPTTVEELQDPTSETVQDCQCTSVSSDKLVEHAIGIFDAAASDMMEAVKESFEIADSDLRLSDGKAGFQSEIDEDLKESIGSIQAQFQGSQRQCEEMAGWGKEDLGSLIVFRDGTLERPEDNLSDDPETTGTREGLKDLESALKYITDFNQRQQCASVEESADIAEGDCESNPIVAWQLNNWDNSKLSINGDRYLIFHRKKFLLERGKDLSKVISEAAEAAAATQSPNSPFTSCIYYAPLPTMASRKGKI